MTRGTCCRARCCWRLLLVLLGLCVAAGAVLPASFPADLGAGVRRFDAPDRSDTRVECRGGAALERAEQLVDFQLFVLVFLAFVYALGCYAVAVVRYWHRVLTVAHDKYVAATAMEEL